MSVSTRVEVIVAPSRESSGFAVVGDAVNVAARLAGLALAGQVIVGESTKGLYSGDAAVWTAPTAGGQG